MKQKQTAFTLIELLVVIVIVGILATLSTATYSGYIEQARKTKRDIFALETNKEFLRQVLFRSKLPAIILQFNEGSGAFTQDSSGSENHMTNLIPADWSSDTFDGEGASFRSGVGTSQLSLPNVNVKNKPVDEISFSVFLKLEDSGPSGNQGIIAAVNVSTGLMLRWDGRIGFYVNNNVSWGNPDNVYSPPNTIKKGKWYHVLGQYKDGTLQLFVDGTKVGEKTGVTLTSNFDSGNIIVGMGDNRFDGYIDNLNIYPIALTGLEELN